MDGMVHLSPGASGNPVGAQFLGILYAEDFDDAAPPEHGPAALAAEPLTPALTQADIDAACIDAVASARVEWEASALQRRNSHLAALEAALVTAKQEAEAVAIAAAEATIPTILAILAGALPKLCDEHGPAEARALLDRILPLLRTEPKISIRVHPDLVTALRQEIIDLQPDFAGTISVTAAAVERGDVRVAWENGTLVRDTRQILQAMQDALGAIGLKAAVETSPKRKMAYAG